MGRKLSSIEITFENIDSVKIPKEYILRLLLSDISSNIRARGDGEFEERRSIGCAYLEIDKNANDAFEGFGKDLDLVNYGVDNFFCRIMKNRDITYIELVFDDGTSESFSVAWNDEDEFGFTNSFQNSLIDKNGNLCVKIGEKYE